MRTNGENLNKNVVENEKGMSNFLSEAVLNRWVRMNIYYNGKVRPS